ncbi:hypothetical protein Pfo_028492 [Paulownia fortunei]|nr:hypothetical protein Pfo_028492 [Paulownia fortunei]
MERPEVSLEARPVAEERRMITWGRSGSSGWVGSVFRLARWRFEFRRVERQLVTEAAVTSTRHSQDQPIVQQFCDYASTTITSPEKTEKIVDNIPSQLCSTSCQSNSVSKLRPKLTEAEKEARKLRRVLANRESARQTIRRRQAMYLELTRKAADVLEENEKLKKEKELAVEEYNSLKGGNEFLKAQPKTSQAEISCSATTRTPIFLHNQPSIVPCFWPSIFPSSDVFQFQCASQSNDMSSSQYPMPHRDIPCPHQGQENSMGIARPGTPLFVFPVPWFLPFLTHSCTLHSHSGTNDRKNTHQCSTCSCSETLLHEDKNRLSSNQNMRVESSNSMKTISVGSVHGAGFTSPPDSGDQRMSLLQLRPGGGGRN